jgi:hypothetical protein
MFGYLLWGQIFFLRFSSQRLIISELGSHDLRNKMFFGFLFLDHKKGLKFLQECGLLKGEMFCPMCGSNMHLWRSESIIGKCRRRRGKGKGGEHCNATWSLRHSSWFTKSKLSLLEIMLLTFDIMQRVPSQAIQKEC